MADQPATFDLGNITERIKLGYNEDDLDEDVLAFLLDNEMDIPDQEFTLNEVAVSTSNDQAMIELTKALEEDQRPPLPAIAEKPKQRFKSLTVEELCEIESKKQSSTTKAKTKWGMKILQGGSKTCKKINKNMTVYNNKGKIINNDKSL